MGTAHRVVLIGNSIVLAGVEKSLRKYPRLVVISTDASPELAERELAILEPHAVILDLGMMTKEFAFELVRDHPGLTVIGLAPGGDWLLALSGEQARGLGTEDLVRLIERDRDSAEPGDS